MNSVTRTQPVSYNPTSEIKDMGGEKDKDWVHICPSTEIPTETSETTTTSSNVTLQQRLFKVQNWMALLNVSKGKDPFTLTVDVDNNYNFFMNHFNNHQVVSTDKYDYQITCLYENTYKFSYCDEIPSSEKIWNLVTEINTLKKQILDPEGRGFSGRYLGPKNLNIQNIVPKDLDIQNTTKQIYIQHKQIFQKLEEDCKGDVDLIFILSNSDKETFTYFDAVKYVMIHDVFYHVIKICNTKYKFIRVHENENLTDGYLDISLTIKHLDKQIKVDPVSVPVLDPVSVPKQSIILISQSTQTLQRIVTNLKKNNYYVIKLSDSDNEIVTYFDKAMYVKIDDDFIYQIDKTFPHTYAFKRINEKITDKILDISLLLTNLEEKIKYVPISILEKEMTLETIKTLQRIVARIKKDPYYVIQLSHSEKICTYFDKSMYVKIDDDFIYQIDKRDPYIYSFKRVNEKITDRVLDISLLMENLDKTIKSVQVPVPVPVSVPTPVPEQSITLASTQTFTRRWIILYDDKSKWFISTCLNAFYDSLDEAKNALLESKSVQTIPLKNSAFLEIWFNAKEIYKTEKITDVGLVITENRISFPDKDNKDDKLDKDNKHDDDDFQYGFIQISRNSNFKGYHIDSSSIFQNRNALILYTALRYNTNNITTLEIHFKINKTSFILANEIIK